MGVVVQGPSAEIRYANRCALRLLGLTMDQLLGKTSFDPDWDVVRLDGTPFPGSEHPAPQAIRLRRSVLDVLMGVRRDKLGERVWLLVSAEPRLNDQGEVRDVLVTFSDISEQRANAKNSEQALRLAERHLQEQAALHAAVFRAMSEGVVLHGPDASIRMANEAASTLLGLTKEQLMGRSPTDPQWGLVRPDGTPLPPEEIPSEITRHTGQPVRLRLLGVDVPDRGRSWLAVTTDPVHPEADPPHHVVATLADVSGLRATRLALERSEALFTRVTQAVPGVIFEIARDANEQWSFPFLSGQVEEVFGLPKAKVENPLGLLEVIPRSEIPAIRQAMFQASQSSRPAELEVRLERPSGEGWIKIWANPDPEQLEHRWTGFVVDVTEAHRIQEGMRHTQRLEAMASLSAGVAHNFNNMLAAIVPNLEFALTQAPEPLREPLEDALTAASSASELVRQLLFAARGEGEHAPSTVCVSQVLAEAVHLCRNTFDAQVRLHLALEPPTLYARGSVSLVQQVMLNLMINARDAVAEVAEPTICVRAFRSQGAVVIEVEDNGIGMSSDVQARIGEPFFTTKPPGQGTGLGLASIYGMVSDVGGRIELRSALGRGTTFRVILPEGESPAVVAVSPSQGTSALSGRRVLVIDDEPLVRRALNRTMAKWGLAIVEAESGEEGLTCIDDTIDAVLLDLSMPGLPGHEVLQRIRIRYPGLPWRWSPGT